jgi:hypothetical protein
MKNVASSNSTVVESLSRHLKVLGLSLVTTASNWIEKMAKISAENGINYSCTGWYNRARHHCKISQFLLNLKEVKME